MSPLWLLVVHTTDWLPNGAGLWLPHYLVWFVGGMVLAVLAAEGLRCYALAAVPVAIATYLVTATPIAGEIDAPALTLGQDVVKVTFYAAIATLVVTPPALGDTGWYSRLLASAPMVRLGEISYEIFLLHVLVMEIAMVSVLRWPVYTGSVVILFLVTLALTVPAAWLLHRLTRPRTRKTPVTV